LSTIFHDIQKKVPLLSKVNYITAASALTTYPIIQEISDISYYDSGNWNAPNVGQTAPAL